MAKTPGEGSSNSARSAPNIGRCSTVSIEPKSSKNGFRKSHIVVFAGSQELISAPLRSPGSDVMQRPRSCAFVPMKPHETAQVAHGRWFSCRLDEFQVGKFRMHSLPAAHTRRRGHRRACSADNEADASNDQRHPSEIRRVHVWARSVTDRSRLRPGATAPGTRSSSSSNDSSLTGRS